MPEEPLPAPRRKEIFLALVEAQDNEMSPAESRKAVAARFAVSEGLAGRAAGHGPLWKAMCLRVGARPERLSFAADMPLGRWRATCAGCGALHHRHRRPKRMVGWWCCKCGPERGRLSWSLSDRGERHPNERR